MVPDSAQLRRAKDQRTLTPLTTDVLKAIVRTHDDGGECQASSLPFCRLTWSIKGGWIFILKQKHAADCCLEALSAKPHVRHLFKRADDKPVLKTNTSLGIRPHVFFWGIHFLRSISKLSWKECFWRMVQVCCTAPQRCLFLEEEKRRVISQREGTAYLFVMFRTTGPRRSGYQRLVGVLFVWRSAPRP